jgi:hypothetical protein
MAPNPVAPTDLASAASLAAAAPHSNGQPATSKRGGASPLVWALVALCAGFGGVAAWALFLRKPEPAPDRSPAASATGSEPVTVANGASPPPPPVAAPVDPATPTTATDSAASPSATGGASAPGKGLTTPTPGTSSKPASSGSPIDLSSFGSSPGGPTTGPTTGPGASTGKGALSEGEINGVVSSNKPRITRKCWNPAYDARASNAPKSAKVMANLKIGPSGSVTSPSASGASEHYPGLAPCVAGSMRCWTFPPSDAGATVNIPFVFSGQ